MPEPELCSVVTSLTAEGDWFPRCSSVTSGKRVPVLDLPICDSCYEGFMIQKIGAVLVPVEEGS